MDKPKLGYYFEMEKVGACGEFIEWPVQAISPQGAADVLRMLLENRHPQVAEIRIKVRELQ